MECMIVLKNRNTIKKISRAIVCLIIIIAICLFYFTLLRGWESRIVPNNDNLSEICSIINSKTDDLNSLVKSFKEFGEKNESITTRVEFVDTDNFAGFDIIDNSFDGVYEYDFDSVYICVSDIDKPHYKSFFTDISLLDKEAYVKCIRKEYGKLDPFYNLFSNQLKIDGNTVYIFPFSRERSEFFSFTGVKIIEVVVTTESSILCFSIRTHNSDYNKVLDSFVQILQEIK